MAFSSSTQSSIDLLNSQSTFKNYLLSQVDGDDNSSLSFSSSSSKSTDRQIRKQRNELRSVRENEKLLQQYENKLNKIYKKKPNQREKNSRKKSIPINQFDKIPIESSEACSNYILCSDLETNTSNSSSNSEFRSRRKKFIKSVLTEDTHQMKVLLSKHDLTTIRDKHKNTLMHIACGFGRLKSVQTLMKLCPRLVELADEKGHTPIDIAIKHGQIEVIKWLFTKTNLVQSGLEANFKSKSSSNQRSYLHFAAKHGENEILRYILSEMYKSNLSVDVQDLNGNTAAHLAAKYNHLKCLQTLVEFNCDITIVNHNGHTPCFIAEYHRHQECVHYLMIVETCITLSIKVVKLGRKLREARGSNEVLRAQMDEAIAINNDFINQRENCMNISLDLMQKQINDLGAKMMQQVERLETENSLLQESLRKYDRKKENKAPKLYENDSSINVNSIQSNKSSVQSIRESVELCQQELQNTKKSCNKILKMDQTKMENIKSKFNEIVINIDTNKADRCNASNFDSNDIIESREHLDVLRKIYQETTHKLMIFRNALKERNLYAQHQQDNQHQQQPYRSNSQHFENNIDVRRVENNNIEIDWSRDHNGAEQQQETSSSCFAPHYYAPDKQQNNCDLQIKINSNRNDYVNDEGLDYSSDDEENETVSQDQDYHDELNYDPTNSDDIIDEGIEYLNENSISQRNLNAISSLSQQYHRKNKVSQCDELRNDSLTGLRLEDILNESSIVSFDD